jgi:iron complex outermembrane receptor protein
MRVSRFPRSLLLASALAIAGQVAHPAGLVAQTFGTVSGTVTRADDGSALQGVSVTVQGTGISTVTSPRGKYTLERTPAGAQVLVFRWVGYAPKEVPTTITAGGTVTADIAMEALPVTLSEILVSGASKAPERITEAPSAISQVDPRALRTASITGQAPLALRGVPGVDLTQSGVFDFNVNARGFNSTLNRRVLTLQDGRDLAIAFLGSQEWNAISIPTEDMRKMEFVSGPGSALYGANAYSGVLDITTPTAREVLGTQVSLGGGLLSGLDDSEKGGLQGTSSGSGTGGSNTSARFDIRHATMFGQGRFGLKVNAGLTITDTWSRSRTMKDSTAIQQEYEPVYCADLSGTDCLDTLAVKSPKRAPELLALRGQTFDPVTGNLIGDRDPIKTYYGGLRFDHYMNNGGVVTAEGGAARVENEVFVTGIGRVQVYQALRPWARVNVATEKFDVMAYWNSRNTQKPQYSLASTAPLHENSHIFHLEGQANESFSDDRGKFVYGASARNTRLDTDETLMRDVDDERSDYMFAAYAQLGYEINDATRMVVAARVDHGTLIDPQFSPKVALVMTPSEGHAFRFTFNRAFQTPNYSEYYLRIAAGVANLLALETALRASALGPALAATPVGTLYTTSSAVPVVGRGNSKLGVESNTGFEVGYKGDISRKLYLSIDAYFNMLDNFVTDLLPGVNTAFKFWTAPTTVPTAFRGAVEGATRSALLGNPASRTAGLGLTRQEDATTAIVLSYANAGSANQYGVDLGAGYQITDEIRADGSVSFFDYSVDEDEVAGGDNILANTPKWRTYLSLGYTGRQGLDVSVSGRTSSGFPWAAGVFVGDIESAFLMDGTLGYRITNNFRVYLTGTNLLDTQWFSMYGGSVNGRRVMGGVTATF